MCPQLFINYKLQSVAHLPWRQMTYKFLNTIIDDLFAFVIKMPMLHRLSVFRDGVFSLELSYDICHYCDLVQLLLPSYFYLFIYFFIELFCGGFADIIFLIYLYQRWMYPVDKKRLNEFGFGGEDETQSLTSTGAATAQDDEVSGGNKKTN